MSDAQALPTTRTPWQTYAVLAGGIVAVSLAAIFIRLAQDEGISSLLIAASRLTIAALVLTPFTIPRYTTHIGQLIRSDWILVVVSGLFLSLHFILWITSLEHTTVLVSVVLVNTTPLWSALLEFVFLRSRLNQLIFLGLIVAITGSIVISLPNGELALGSNPLLGSLLAIGGAITVAVYYVIGRKLRSKLPLFPYIWLVYGLAAIVTCLAVFITYTPITGYSPQSYIWLVAIALVPQLVGHSSFNYALGYLSATYVGIATQLEPAGSALMAFFLFREVPRPLQILGSVIILIGVSLASLGQNRST
jgi:drug/metabolite transporter (DMT)-like permease